METLVHQIQLLVLPFDYDGDGLENAVDPEPLVADAADAHGTNAEWYRVVCTNVFEIADTSNIQTFPDSNIPEGVQFRSGVNTNAYYFVDVVAAEGPAPVYFTADRVSRLGSPAVVARAGETNRMPLLVGVTYALTSSVPLRVELPTNGFAKVVSSCENACTLRWPLEIDLVEDLTSSNGRSFTLAVSPFDPGGTVAWGEGGSDATDSSGGASLSGVATPSVGCPCVSGNGYSLSLNSSSAGSCGGGCAAGGAYTFEGALFPFSFEVCTCSREDGDDRPTVDRMCWPLLSVGEATLVTTNYIGPMHVSFQGIAVSEVPCSDEDIITGCFTNGHFRTHGYLAGAGRAKVVQEGNFWFVDAAGSKQATQNWSPGSRLVWKIPIGWYRRFASLSANETSFGVQQPDYERSGDPNSRHLLIGGRIDLYKQERYIDDDGVFRTDKYGHWISRSRWCHVILDGVDLQMTHPLW